VSAEETIQLRFITGFANEKQQVPLFRFALHYGDIERIAQVRGNSEFEELAVAIALDIEGIVLWVDPRVISLRPAGWNLTHSYPSAQFGKPGFNRLSIHMY